MIRSKTLLLVLAVLVLVLQACSTQVTPQSTQVLPAPTTAEPETQVVVVNTVEVSTPTSQPAPSNTPLLRFTPTVQAAQETVAVTAPPSPQPTPTSLRLLTARIEGDTKKIDGTIFWPDFGGPASTELVFWVEARDPEVGDQYGAGITSVDFVITDSNGQTVYNYTAKESPYCAFGGSGTDCNVFHFADSSNQWPVTNLPIQDGDFSLTVTVNADDGSQWSGTAAFSIKLP